MRLPLDLFAGIARLTAKVLPHAATTFRRNRLRRLVRPLFPKEVSRATVSAALGVRALQCPGQLQVMPGFEAVSPAELIDGSAADFSAGCTDAGAYVAPTFRSEVILAPKMAAEFTGDVLPDGWTVTPWVDGGTGTLEDGMLSLDGASVRCEPILLSPRSLEFSAVFAARPDQHAGFGTNFVDVPWVMFSTKWGRRLYGRTHLLNVDDKKLAGDWFDAPHRFRIDWNILDIAFSIDGTRLAHLMVPMPGHMRPLAANQRLGQQPLRIEWMRVSPFEPSGRFTSRVLDAGTVADWRRVSWEADVPERTSLVMHVRTGDVARPGRTWSPWRPVRQSGDAVAAASRFLQYRVDLATTDPAWTPVLREVCFGYSAAGSGDAAGSGESSSSFVSGRCLGFQ